MLEAYAYRFLLIVNGMAKRIACLDEQIAAGQLEFSAKEREEQIRFWCALDEEIQEVELKSAGDQVGRIFSELFMSSSMTRSRLRTLVEELKNRIEDELRSCCFLHISASRTRYWQNENLFGEEARRIADAGDHIYEAGCCFAVGRWSATVYHCMGIIQAGFFELGEHLPLSRPIDLQTDNWDTAKRIVDEAIEKLDQEAQVRSSRGDKKAWSDWQKRGAELREVSSDLGAIARAWRNTSAHYRQTFDEEKARKILDRTGEFIRRVAALLAIP